MFISASLLCLSIYIYCHNPIRIPIYARILFSVGVAVSSVFFLLFISAHYLTGDGITEGAIYFTFYGLSGAGFSEYFWEISLLFSLVLLIFFFALWLIVKPAKATGIRYPSGLVFFFAALSLYFNPTTMALTSYLTPKPIAANSDFFDYYTQPAIEQAGESKNLVFIYAEGLERTYLNNEAFPGLTPHLGQLESKSTSFTNIDQDKYSHHTIGGMVASQCGFPLVTPSHANSMSGMDHYLQSAICLGDLLHKENYHLSYYGGSELDFAGKGKFYATHKFDRIQGKKDLVARLEDKSYLSDWGLFDDSLLPIVYDEFIKISQKKSHFAMFLVTLDTHHPNGIPSKICSRHQYKDGENPMLNAVACSDYLLGDFVKKIRESKFSKDTVIVIASDHLAFKNAASFDTLRKQERKNLFLVNTDDPTMEKVDTPGSTLDLGSTTLPYIGYRSEIGLGRDLNAAQNVIPDLQGRLEQWEPNILQFWNFPTIENSFEIDIDNNKIKIDDRHFSIPVLVELNYKLETKVKFELSWTRKFNLKGYVEKSEGPFLLIDSCDQTSEVSADRIASPNTCLLAGKGNEYVLHQELDTNVSFTPLDIRKMTKAF
jgi:phosphoglycerol transferase